MQSHKRPNFVVGFLIAILLLSSSWTWAQSTGGRGTDLEAEMPGDAKRLKIGDAAPDFSLKGIDDKMHTLADYKDASILMIAFLSNHCPASHAAETRLIPLANEMKDKGVVTVAINPNNPDGLHIDELGY